VRRPTPARDPLLEPLRDELLAAELQLPRAKEKTGVPPRVVFDVASRTCEHKDVDQNRRVYAELGVAEYYWFEPSAQELTALRLDPDAGRYAPARPEPSGRFASPALGLEVGVHEGEIRLFEAPAPVLSSEELLRESARALDEERRRRQEAERPLADLERRLTDLENQLRRDAEDAP